MPFHGHAIIPGLAVVLDVNFLAKTYWRVLIFRGGDGLSNTGASEVRFKAGGVAQSGTSLGSGGAHANAFDGSTSTNWTVSAVFGEYVGLQFSNESEIDEVDIVAIFNDSNDTLVDYAVQFSDDGAVWTTLWDSFGNNRYTSNGQTRTTLRPFAPLTGAGLVDQRAVIVMGSSPDAMVNRITVSAVHGASDDAMVNSIQVYAIYDSGS